MPPSRYMRVQCKACRRKPSEDEIVEFYDIYENEFGEDVLVFKCPKCGEKSESKRYTCHRDRDGH